MTPPPPEEADDSEDSMDTVSEKAESLSGLSVRGPTSPSLRPESSLPSRSPCRLLISNLTLVPPELDRLCWENLCMECEGVRPPPMLPPTFECCCLGSKLLTPLDWDMELALRWWLLAPLMISSSMWFCTAQSSPNMASSSPSWLSASNIKMENVTKITIKLKYVYDATLSIIS